MMSKRSLIEKAIALIIIALNLSIILFSVDYLKRRNERNLVLRPMRLENRQMIINFDTTYFARTKHSMATNKDLMEASKSLGIDTLSEMLENQYRIGKDYVIFRKKCDEDIRRIESGISITETLANSLIISGIVIFIINAAYLAAGLRGERKSGTAVGGSQKTLIIKDR